MDIKKLNKLIEQALDEAKSKKFIQIGSFHSDPENIYCNMDPKLADEFSDRDFDNFDSCELDGNLLFLSANDEHLSIRNTPYKTFQQFKNDLKAGYEFEKKIVEKDGGVEVGCGIPGEPEVFENYIMGYGFDEDDFPENAEEFCEVLVDWLDSTYIDKDSSSLYTFVDPKNMQEFITYDPEDWEDEDDEEYEEYEEDDEPTKEKTFAEWFGKDLTGQTYDRDINCTCSKLTSLEGAPKIVNGNFCCSSNKLTSLKGAPKKVDGNFYCSSNKLTSLEGAPKIVNGNFDCSWNNLTSLKGAPEIVKGDFDCHRNMLLTTLEGAPKEVGGNFDCEDSRLTTLEGAPETVGGYFNCRETQLTSLEGAPEKVGGGFDCSWNGLISLEGAPKEIEGEFDCCYNNLTSLKGAPEIVKGNFNCNDNQLTSLQGAPKEVGGDFNCYCNKLTSLEGVPEKVGGEILSNL